MTIVIIDSGLDKNSIQHRENIVQKTFLRKKTGEVELYDGAKDDIGHGTAIFHIIDRHIKNHCSNIEYIIIKVIQKDMFYTDEIVLTAALTWLVQNKINCNIINISLGCTMLANSNALYNACYELSQKGCVIVSAFDNNGAVSYPAAFDAVIGVTTSDKVRSKQDYIPLNSNVVNVCAYGGTQMLEWLNGEKIISGGDSFACAHITGIIAQYLYNHKTENQFLMEQLLKTRTLDQGIQNNKEKKIELHGKKVALFPFSKEMHALIRFKDMLPFEISNVYDIPRSGKVGAKIGQLLGDSKYNDVVKNISDIDTNDFDIMILGHTRELSEIYNWNKISPLVHKVVDSHKHIYSFDDLNLFYQNRFSEDVIEHIFSPKVEFDKYTYAPLGKLYRNSKPTLAVVGTSSKQGKFTLQLELRRKFINQGYNVGQIGSEPTSLLFGFDHCIPFGYEATIGEPGINFIKYVNYSIFDLCRKNVDIIICGSQSGSITLDYGNVFNYPLYQTQFLMAVNPDAIVLCVNPYDSFDDIKRSIAFLESCTESKVVGLCIFPLDRIHPEYGIYSAVQKLDNTKMENLKNTFLLQTGIPAYQLDDSNDIDHLFQTILSFFSE